MKDRAQDPLEDSPAPAGEPRRGCKSVRPAGCGSVPTWSKQLRRNSSLEVRFEDGCPRVAKTYHREYTASEEFDAYQRLSVLCQGVEGVSCPRIYSLDADQNTIVIEYVAGIDLRQAMVEGGVKALRPHEEALLELLVGARSRQLRFDSDPANIIFSAADGSLVLVDPVCRAIDIPDFALVVYLFGLLKAAVANPWRVGWLELGSSARSFCGRYCERCTAASPRDIRHQLADYLKVVISWNREANVEEAFGLRMARLWLWVPMLTVVRLWLRR